MSNRNAQDLWRDVQKLNDALAEADRVVLRLGQLGPDHLSAALRDLPIEDKRRACAEVAEQVQAAAEGILKARDMVELIRPVARKAAAE